MFIHYLLRHPDLITYRPRSFFVMRRTITSVNIQEKYNKWVFNIEAEGEKYPIIIRLSPKQLFLLKPLLERNFVPIKALDSKEALMKGLEGCSMTYLKYAHDFDAQKQRVIYWTLQYIGADVQQTLDYFQQSCEKGFLQSYHPEKIPTLQVPTLPNPEHLQKKSKRSKNGTLHLYYMGGFGCILKNYVVIILNCMSHFNF